ncbi:MAG: nucleotidyltransferase family protein [Pseudomonadota bacterium]
MNLDELRKYKPAIRNLANNYKIDPDSIRVFGSVARGEEQGGSDIDLLVRTLPDCGLLKIGGFYVGLEDLLHCKVDIVNEKSISPYLKDSILSSAVPL